MNQRRAAAAIALVVAAIAIAWVLFVGLPRWTAPPPPRSAASAAARSSPPPAPTRRIRARLYWMTPDGVRLQTANAEVEFAEAAEDQARRLVDALLGPAPQSLLTPFPPGTKMRTLYLAPQGVAFVDLTGEVSRNHPGGVLEEILTVYSLVNTLTDNLPAVTAVQILVDGHEVETLAGHVDLRSPLSKSLQWTEPPQTAAPAR
jgi:spore germination protein GerM